MATNRSTLRLELLLCLALLCGPAGCGRKPVQGAGVLLEQWGLHAVVYQTPSGEIRILLPNPLRSGESVSGTVERKASGENDTAVAAHNLELGRYSFRTSSGEILTKGGLVHWTVPDRALGATIMLTDRGKELGRVVVPIDTSVAPVTPASHRLPHAVQAGDRMILVGPFDGDLANSQVFLGGRQAAGLAEAPSGIVVQTPIDLLGPVQAVILDAGNRTEGSINFLQLAMTAGTTELSEGEWTDLEVQISGLEGVREALSLRIQNNSPSVARLEEAEGILYWRIIRPEDVQSDGIFTFRSRLTGRAKGAFTIDAMVGLARINHSRAASWRPVHAWWISSRPDHYLFDSRKQPHREVISKLKPHDPALSGLPEHSYELSDRRGSDHAIRISWRTPHKAKISNRLIHASDVSKSEQPVHVDTLSALPIHEVILSRSGWF